MGGVELGLVARGVALVLSVLGLGTLSVGPGGAWVNVCVTRKELRRASEEWLEASIPRRPNSPLSEKLRKLTRSVDCDMGVQELVLFSGYLPIDALFFGPRPPANASGTYAVRRRLSHTPSFYPSRNFHSAPFGPDNIIFAVAGPIKLAWLFSLAASLLSLVVFLTTLDLLCYTQPNIIVLERFLLVSGCLHNCLAATLGFFAFAGAIQLPSSAQDAGLRSLVCPAWPVSAVILAIAAVFQALDAGFALCFKDVPRITNPKPKPRSSPRSEEKSDYFTRAQGAPDYSAPLKSAHPSKSRFQPSRTGK